MNDRSYGIRAGALWLSVLVGGIAALLAPAQAAGQDAAGFSFVGGIAYEPGGPGPALVDEMVASGYTDQLPATCTFVGCEAEDHPFYFDEGLNIAALVGMRYRFGAPFSLEMLFSNGQRGHAEGYNHRARDYRIISYTSFLLTTTAGAHLGPFRVEAGPVLNSTGWGSTRNSSRSSSGRTATLGGTVGVTGSVRLPDALVSLKVGIRGFPRTDIRNAVQAPFAPDYHSFFIGLTAIPTDD